MSLPKYRPLAAASVFRGVPGASVAWAVLTPTASGAMAATTAVKAPVANIRCRDERDRRSFMAILLSVES
jgi:hypothetical protein